MVLIGNKDNFDNIINDNNKVLVDFNATWCGPCRMLKPIIDELAEERDNIKIVSVDIDDEEILSSKYNIMSIPCLVLFENGKEIGRNVGFINKEEVERFIGD